MEVIIAKPPHECPYCGTTLIKRKISDGNEGADIICPNKNCIGIKKSHLLFVVGKSCFDIKDFGESTVNLLFDNNIITNWYDIFLLTVDDFINKANLTQYSAEKLYYNIQNVKNLASGEVLLYSIGISSIGRIKAKKIIDILGTLDNVNLTDDIINSISKEIGPESTKHLLEYVFMPQYKEIIKFFKDNGFNITNKITEIEKISNSLNGLKLLASGTFENYSREEIKKTIESHGGTYASGVNKTLDIFICGNNVGPSKIEKAKKLNIKIISEKDFEKMIN